MTQKKSTSPVKALGLCSGGLDSMLSALVLKNQGIAVTWVGFETPFFSSANAKKASETCGIPLITQDITAAYMEMIKAPKAGFGKNMNPCMDCHALMFENAGHIMNEQGFDFLFSGEVVGQRPKSQTKNALQYVAKNSGFKEFILRPLSALCLPETPMEAQGLVDRTKLLGINGRSRKPQMALAKKLGITEYPAPAGGCLLTDPQFSNRLKDLLYIQKTKEVRLLHLLRYGRHFRLTDTCKLVMGRSESDNEQILTWYDPTADARLNHAFLPGPTALLTGSFGKPEVEKAGAMIAAYTKTQPGEKAEIRVTFNQNQTLLKVVTPAASDLASLMI
ncbi:MAG: tRNA 4-thiouridine(8) synthase ThiI [Desulfotignum sp.]|nr:tRNA 4-thiouridine(8) synthase ThiI [Desulfotignum sp.]MCF8113823.1 tRNA 4-thiouridine(8) synthase ThiI [Desulfotignum sp.]MCF8126011.1 tRNA 4-thiouridine(8) synthase ThiI [Desulfotignum sp.]